MIMIFMFNAFSLASPIRSGYKVQKESNVTINSIFIAKQRHHVRVRVRANFGRIFTPDLQVVTKVATESTRY